MAKKQNKKASLMSMKKGQIRKRLDGPGAKPFSENLEERGIFQAIKRLTSIVKARYEKSTIDIPRNDTQ